MKVWVGGAEDAAAPGFGLGLGLVTGAVDLEEAGPDLESETEIRSMRWCMPSGTATPRPSSSFFFSRQVRGSSCGGC